MKLNDIELGLLQTLSKLEERHQQHTPTEVMQRYRRDNKDVPKPEIEKAWTVLVTGKFIKEWVNTLTIAEQKARLSVYRTSSRFKPHLAPIRTTYCQLTGKAIMLLDGRLSEDSVSSTSPAVYDSTTPFQSVRALQKVFEEATTSIKIVDNYIGPKTLDYLISVPEIPIQIIAEQDKFERGFQTAYEAFKQEYNSTIQIADGGKKFHGRFIIADDNGYLIDHSIKQFADKPTALIPLEPEATAVYLKLFDEAWHQASETII